MRVLSTHLGTMRREPKGHRYGQVFVGSIEEARAAHSNSSAFRDCAREPFLSLCLMTLCWKVTSPSWKPESDCSCGRHSRPPQRE